MHAPDGLRGGWTRTGTALAAAALLLMWMLLVATAPRVGAQDAPTTTAAPTTTVAAQGATSEVTVVHGLRGQLVDVYLDGTRLLESFAPDRLTDPMAVTAGTHHLELRPGGSDPTAPAKVSVDLDVPAGQDLSVVAHFDTQGQWTTTVYRDDVTAPTAGDGSVVFRNDAATQPIDISVDGAKLVSSLANPSEIRQVLGSGDHSVQVNTSGAADVLVPSNAVSVQSGGTTFLYLVGTTTGLTWLSQRVDAPRVLPATISAGNSGLADPAPAASGHGTLVLVATVLLAAAASGGLALRRRTR